MKRLYLILLLLAGCQFESPIQIATATSQPEPAFIWGNSLASDGCEEYVQLVSEYDPASSLFRGYKPSPASLPIVQQALAVTTADSWGRKVVRLQFSRTGKQVMLRCGWGAQLPISEIEIYGFEPLR